MAALAVLTVVVAAGVFSYARIASIRSGLRAAEANLSEARSLAAGDRFEEAAAKVRLAVADADAVRRKTRGPTMRIMSAMPLLGPQARTVRAISEAAAQVSRAADLLIDAAARSPLLNGVANLGIRGLALDPLLAQIAPVIPTLREASAMLERASQSMSLAPKRGVGAALWDVRRAVETQLAQARTQVDVALHLHEFGTTVANGNPLRILMLSQLTWEVRPAGGFIGSYGILRLDRDGLALEEYDDAVAFPAPDPPYVAPEPIRSALDKPFGLSQTGWWPDFPTAAKAAAEIFRHSGGGEIDGVLAVTQTFLEDIVRGLGEPVTVPGYPDVLTPENISERTLHHIELKRPLDRPRKKFLIELNDVIFDRLRDVPAERSGAVARALADALRSRHAQIWFADPAHHRPFTLAGWDGRLGPTGTDLLSVIDANMTGSKSNRWVRKKIVYRVYRFGSELRGTVTVRTEHTGPDIPTNHLFNSYLRVYTMNGSAFLPANDREKHSTIVKEDNGLISLGTWHALRIGESDERTFNWRIGDEAVRDCTYRLLVRPQASASADDYEVRVDLGGETKVFRFKGDAGDQTIEVPIEVPPAGTRLGQLVDGLRRLFRPRSC
ncbi:MAG TPA: DUF4012 domain-containing protein [Actinomycetota bacterium]|nr:DUF4012 domain-containing protein [Actinomycetota bacterium]